MIAPTPFFADRGCHTQIYEEIKSLQKLGHQIVLCTYGLGRDVPGVRTARCLNFPWYRKLEAGPSFTKILLLPLLTLTVLKTAFAFRPDIIHAHLHEGACIARVCKYFFRRKKYIFDMQGTLTGELLQHKFISQTGLPFRFYRFMEQRIAGWFPVITQSESMLGELRLLKGDGVNAANVKDGVDTEIFHPVPFDAGLGARLGIDPEKPRILFMGLLEEYQGVDIMLNAFAKASLRMPDLQFIVIGYPNIGKYEGLCKSLGISGKVKFLGRIKYQELPSYLSLSRVAVAPKIAATEGDGKIYNYMAMGMATVAFDRSVSREILGDAAFFCRAGDAGDLADKIVHALSSPGECEEKGRLARDRAVKHLSWDAVGRRIDEVYRRLQQ
ncbi:MAG: hypothetical protein A2X45_12695 [Lentisphaerae bacterium GWF2_50_93]|nr:MAG: hypothetical protein A2X45_12695 [Lentisphaerae bacterium GWF2_50_93]